MLALNASGLASLRPSEGQDGMSVITMAKLQLERTASHAGVTSLLITGATIVGVISAVVFYVFPEIDLDTAALFYDGKSGFYGAQSESIHLLRSLILGANVAVVIVATVGLLASLVLKGSWLRLPSIKWLFLFACLIVGPGLTSNALLKDNWGRARPSQIVEFGGSKAYTPPVEPSNQCERNCSFVAGEASTIYIAFFASACLFPSLSGTLVVAAVVAGSLAGLVRMMQGAHFLSDVIFAGVAMALVAGAVQLIFSAVEQARTRANAKNTLA
jgi:lipid A 4'-phosphatase